MSFSLNRIFTPITAQPFRSNNGYVEILPSKELKPYIRCFWGSRETSASETSPTNVIPDICTDIIINVDLNSNTFSDVYCGINNKPFISHSKGEHNDSFTFGIRFYAWSAILFSGESMKESLNDYCKSQNYFGNLISDIKNEIIYSNDIFERKEIAERALMKRLNKSKENTVLMNSLYNIISADGNISVKDLSGDCYISKRQLERFYSEYTGVSPKQMIELIRYQKLWRNILRYDFDINEAIEKFGFYDQSHLLKEFKKYHGENITDAKKAAMEMSHFYNT